MKFSILAGSALLSSVALAVPFSQENLDRRAFTGYNKPPSSSNQRIETELIYAEDYSDNWAGAILVGSGYTSVSGTFVVPQISVPSGGDPTKQYCASAWVGIDGDTCSSAILQTGVNLCIQNGVISNTAWYEWYPVAQEYYNGFPLDVGDVIIANVTVTSTTGGTSTIINMSKGIEVTYTFVGQTNPLCMQNAEWIMEDASTGDGLLAFADFGSNFAFTDASVIANGKTIDTTGATIIDILTNGQQVTKTTATGSTVGVVYQ